MKLPVVAIVGRPNVGKSTFFNRVLGRMEAIVAPEPGVTRDLHYAKAEWGGRTFYLVDTGGLVEGSAREIDRAVQRQVLRAIEESDVVVQIVDAREGVHPLDRRIAEILRERAAPILLVANKVDHLPRATEHYEFYELGVGDPVPISAISGKGSGDVLDRVVALLPPAQSEEEGEAVRIAVVGRPNVGKSTFVNRALGEDRMVVSSEGGTTRDAVDTVLESDGRRIVFVDTAGLRRRTEQGLEFYSVLRAERAIDRAHVCLLLVDAPVGATNQDFRIARRVWEAGAGLVLVLNKWDVVEKTASTAREYEGVLRERVPFLSHVPIVFVSALTGLGVRRAIDLALEVADSRRRRIPTPQVNRRLRELVAALQPPQVRGRPLRFYYAAQVKSAPPVFAFWTNFPKEVPEHYVRYLINGFRTSFGFVGSPIRVKLRTRRRTRQA